MPILKKKKKRARPVWDPTPEAAFQALADPHRRRILEMLMEGERSAGEVAAAFAAKSWPAVSRHLGVLERAGLVHVRRNHRERRYSVDHARIHEVFGAWVAAFDAARRKQQHPDGAAAC